MNLIRFDITLPALSIKGQQAINFSELSIMLDPIYSISLLTLSLSLCLIALGALWYSHLNYTKKCAAQQKSIASASKTHDNLIREKQYTLARLEDTEHYLNSIINSMPSVLIGITPDGHITHWNARAAAITNTAPENALGQPLLAAYPSLPLTLSQIQDVITHNTPYTQENIKYGHGNDATFWNLTVYPLKSERLSGAVVRFDDVTPQVRLENMMIQNEKMKSLGELSAGMAHEINNPLSAILQGVQNIKRRTLQDLPKNRYCAQSCNLSVESMQQYFVKRDIITILNTIQQAGENASRIVSNMLEFSHSNNLSHRHIDIHQLLIHSLELANNTFELNRFDFKHITIRTLFATDMPQIPCSASEMQQVILNLLRNAGQALSSMPPTHSPCIVLQTSFNSQAVQITVEDNGPGMPESTRRHIFEPFFTTKDVGEGTGLGLSVSYFIITEHHGGQISVESTPGNGTRFTIELPIHRHSSPLKSDNTSLVSA